MLSLIYNFLLLSLSEISRTIENNLLKVRMHIQAKNISSNLHICYLEDNPHAFFIYLLYYTIVV